MQNLFKQDSKQNVRVRRKSVATFAGAAVFSAGLLLSGCNTKVKPTAANYSDTINAYYGDHADCLFDGTVRFPFESSDAGKIKQMDALVTAQLAEGKKESSLHVARYTLTQAGQRAAPNFCFGHRQVVSIDSSTPPAAANGFTETTVSYTYKLEDRPVWARTPEVLAAFPQLQKESTGSAQDRIVLALTGVGWSVPEK